MGSTCFCSINQNEIKRKAKNLIKIIDQKITNCEKEVNELNKSIEIIKNDILMEINNSEDFNINNKVTSLYELKNKNNEKSKILSAYKSCKKDLEHLLEEIKNKSEEKQNVTKRINDKFEKLKNKFESLEINEADNPGEKLSKNNTNSINIKKIKEFCELKDKLIAEKKEVKQTKESIQQMIKFVPYQRNWQNSISNEKNKIEISLQNYKKKLNSSIKQLKEAIIYIIENESFKSNTNNNLDNKIKEKITNLNNFKNETMMQIKRDIENFKISFRKEIIKLKIDNLLISSNLIKQRKTYILSENEKCQKMIDLINQKINEINSIYYIIENDNKNKIEKLNILNKKRNELIEYQNYLYTKLNFLDQLINKLNSLDLLDNNFLNDNIYQQTIDTLKNLENKIDIEINNSNNNNKNFIISEINSEIQNIIQDTSFLIQDFFYNKKDKKDNVYNKLIEEEKINIINTFYLNQEKVKDIISKDNKLNSISFKNDKIINNIVADKNSDKFIKYKIIQEIKKIAYDPNVFKIKNMTVLLVGRKKVGKTSLIKYILGPYPEENEINEYFTLFTSNEMNLRIIEVKGVGLDEDDTPEKIKANIKSYIDNINKKNENQNFENVVNCIWYCISGRKFEKKEKSLFFSLKEIYPENKIPIIIVFTQADEEDEWKKMKNYIRNDNKIDNEFIPVLAEETDEPFGKKELINTTLKKSKKALKGEMQKIMIEQISKYIESSLKKENEKIIIEIENRTTNYLKLNYKNVLNDEGFILYIAKIFFKHLNYFYDKRNIISKESLYLFLESDFISSLKKIYISYKESIRDIIKSIAKEKSKEFINSQAKIEKQYGNMNINNKRNLNEFEKIIEMFLAQNYDFFVQHYIINVIIEKNKLLHNFLSLITDELVKTIKRLLNLNDKDEFGSLARKHLEICFNTKLKLEFSTEINGQIINEVDFPKTSYSSPEIKLIYLIDEKINSYLKKSNSFVFNNNKNINYNNIEEKKINKNIFFLRDKDLKYLQDESLKMSLKDFLEKIKYKESAFDLNKNDTTFSFLQEEIKKDLKNSLNEILFDYMDKIYSNFNDIFTNCFDINEIEQIILNENIEFYYKQKIRESLSKYPKDQDTKILEYISIIITGRTGVGKSTLINELFKENLAKEGTGDITTTEIRKYSGKVFNFLKITDTRGYEFEDEYGIKNIRKDVIKTIQAQKKKTFLEYFKVILGNKNIENEKIKEYYHCIWFCVNSNEIGDKEKNSLEELKKNVEDLPVIVVCTYAKRDNQVESIKKQINDLFPDLPFIAVLARKTEKRESYGLDNLLKLTLKTIKLRENNDIFEAVKNEYKIKETENTKNQILKSESDIIIQLVYNFINNYTQFLNTEDFEKYIYNFFSELIIFFSQNNEISPNTISLIKNNKIKNLLQSYIKFYLNESENILNNLIEHKSIKFLDLQAIIEKTKNVSINTKNKRSQEDFKELIRNFCNDNLYYIAQKYLIFLIIKDVFEDISEKLGKSIYKKMKIFLASDEAKDSYRNIYLRIFDKFEEEKINKFRDKYGKIYN